MNKETIEKANKILKNIKRLEETISTLEYYGKSKKYRLHYDGVEEELEVFLEPYEVDTIIENKKQQVAALEKELEEL